MRAPAVGENHAADDGGSAGTPLAGLCRLFGPRPLLALTILLAGAILSPVLTYGFFGDDFDLWLAGQELLRNPELLLSGPKNFYRPANSWLFAAHHLLFGPHPLGYHTTVLVLHLVCGGLLWRVLGRFSVPPIGCALAAFFWLTSPFTFEPVWAVNVAYNDLTVCAVWLLLVAYWPDHRWTPSRAIGLAIAIVFSLFCKESWGIVPGLAAILELTVRRTSWRTAAVTGAITAIPVALYTALYMVVFSERLGGGYVSGGTSAMLKVPHAWSSFWGFTPMQPTEFPFGLGEIIGTGLLGVCLAIAVGPLRDRLMALGLTLFFLPFIPVLPVPWLPTRYTAAPFAGFVLVAVALATQLIRRARGRRLAIIVVLLVATALNVRQLILLRGDLRDVARLEAAHQELLAQAEAAVPLIPDVEILVCVRLDPTSPQRDLAKAGQDGLLKSYYLRTDAPYDLVNWEALLTFALARQGIRQLWSRTSTTSGTGVSSWAVLAHRRGHIVQLAPREPSPDREREYWEQRGIPVQVITCRSRNAAAANTAALVTDADAG